MDTSLLEDVSQDTQNGNGTTPSPTLFESGSVGQHEEHLIELGLESVAVATGGPVSGKEFDELAPQLFDVSSEQDAAAEQLPDPDQVADLPDAYFGSYDGGPRTRSQGDESADEVVIGTDDRIRINNTSAFPWRVHCSLRIVARTGKVYIGTGWFIGPRTIMTAGHCVFLHNEGGWAKSITVMPGRNGNNLPFGAVTATQFRSVTQWTQSKNADTDYGCIILPENNRLGARTGWLGFAYMNDASLRSKYVNISGYPGDKPAGTQWYHGKQVKRVTGRRIYYEIDTAGGQSGSAVYYIKDGKRYAVGIHAYGASSGNSAPRITEGVFKIMKAWKAMGS